MNGVLLDTCAIIRLASGAGELSRAAMDEIAKAPLAYVSPISLWEIALKAKSGNLVISSVVKLAVIVTSEGSTPSLSTIIA